MGLNIVRIQRLCEVLSEKREKHTRQALVPLSVWEWPGEVRAQDSFDSLVTRMYRAFHEAWGDEIFRLLGLAQEVGASSAEVRRFQGLVDDLRHAAQHDDDDKARRSAARWFRDVLGRDDPSAANEWTRCAEALVEQCIGALQSLVGIVNDVAGDREALARWIRACTASAESDPETELEVALADLGLRISAGQKGHLLRLAEHDWSARVQSLTGNDDSDGELAKVVERVIVGWSLSALPCHYGEIVELVGNSTMRVTVGALELAHGLADLTDYDTSAEFLSEFERVWDMIRGNES